MLNNIEQIYKEIKQKLTVDHLKKITIDIINFYKNKNFSYLRKYIPIIRIDSNTKNEKLFSFLIRKYHPDKHSSILKQANELYIEKNFDKLLSFYNSYFFSIDTVKYIRDIDFKFEPEYWFDKNDPGYREFNLSEKDDFEETCFDYDYVKEEYGFYEAMKKLYYGGQNYTFTESDLRNLDDELNLSDYDIQDLTGIENCIFLCELDLSHNNIEKIGRLSFLKSLHTLYLSNNVIENIDVLENLENLEVLDISYNKISNIDVLENLKKLEYVNLIGNPIEDYSIVNELIKRSVIVIFEENVLQ